MNVSVCSGWKVIVTKWLYCFLLEMARLDRAMNKIFCQGNLLMYTCLNATKKNDLAFVTLKECLFIFLIAEINSWFPYGALFFTAVFYGLYSYRQ